MNHLKTGKAYFRKGSYKNYKYNGQELQETGMYDYGARLYMADIGRFGVLDPLLEDTDQPYAYAGNNPVNFVDYLGMLALPPEDADGYEIGYIYTDSQGSWERVEGGWKSLSIEQSNLVDNIVLQAPGSSSPPAMPINCGACFYNGGGMDITLSKPQVLPDSGVAMKPVLHNGAAYMMGEDLFGISDLFGLVLSRVEPETQSQALGIAALAIIMTKTKDTGDY